MKNLLFFFLVFLLILGCEKKAEPVQKPILKSAEKEEQAVVQEKIPAKVVEKVPQKIEEETVDISNELKKLRIVPDDNNMQETGKCVAYRDADGDKFGDGNDSIEFDCGMSPKVGYTERKGDCNDRNRYVNPGAVETCNGDDDNCDGIIDPEDADGCNRYYKDMDGDGVGTVEFRCLCVSKGVFAALETGDCDDSNKNVHQNARETCNTVDDNCNGQVDEGTNLKGCRPFYYDQDGDGYGYQKDSRCLCRPDGLYRAEVLGDCNDNNISINPGAVEIFDRRDNNCNGAIDENVGITPRHKKHYKKKHGRHDKYDSHHGKDRNKHDKKTSYKKAEKQKKIVIDNRLGRKKYSGRKQHVKPPVGQYKKDDEKKKKKKKKKNSAVIF